MKKKPRSSLFCKYLILEIEHKKLEGLRMEEGDAGIQEGKADGQYLSGKTEVFQKL